MDGLLHDSDGMSSNRVVTHGCTALVDTRQVDLHDSFLCPVLLEENGLNPATSISLLISFYLELHALLSEQQGKLSSEKNKQTNRQA